MNKLVGIQNELKNKMLKRKNSTMLALLTELNKIDDERGARICNVLQNKKLLDNKDTAEHFAQEMCKLLEDSLSLTVTYRSILEKIMKFLITTDTKNMAEGKPPFAMDLLMSKVKFKDTEEE